MRKHIVAALVGCVASWSAAAAPAPQAGRFEAAALAEASAIRADAIALDQAWYRLYARAEAARLGGRADDATLAVRLTLKAAVFQKDLELELYRQGNDWILARAWTPGWNDAEHRADVSGLAWKPAAEGPSIAGRLKLRLMYDGFRPIKGKGLDCELDLAADAKDGKLAGTFSTVQAEGARGGLPPAKDKVAGSYGPIAKPFAPPASMPRQQLQRLDGYKLYAAACAWEQAAERSYREVRAAELSRLAALPYGKALAETILPNIAREPFEPGGAAKEPKAGKDRKQLPRKPKPGVPAPGDAGGALEDELDAIVASAPKAVDAGSPAARRALAALGAMRQRVADMLRFVLAAEKSDPPAAAATEPPRRDSLKTDDPDFGPWYGVEALTCDANTCRHTLPPDAGADAEAPVQRWPCVSAWRVLGPLPITSPKYDTPGLPDAVFDFAARYRIGIDSPAFGQKYSGPDTAAWDLLARERPFGYILPPNWSAANRVSAGCSRAITDRHSGIEHSTLYAAAEIDSPRDVELWTGIGVTQRGKLWIDDRLAWAGPAEVDEAASQSVALTKLKFHKGVNRLLLRVDVGYASPSFWLRLCTAGRPRDAAAAKAHTEAVAKARAAIAPLGSFGYRGDRTGNFPDATPPVAWDLKKKINVLWYTPLPYWSNSSPALAGDRLFVGVEPHMLVCLSKADGRVLWQQPVTLLDLLDDPNRQQGWALYNAWWKLRQERDAIPRSVLRPERWIERSGLYWEEPDARAAGKQDERQGASPELIALLDKRDELEKAPDPVAVADQLTKVLEQVEKLKAAKADPAAEAANNLADRLRAANQAFLAFLRKHSHVSGLEGYWTDYDGYAFATPVTDGKSVWWKNGMDCCACFDMDGKLKWRVRIGAGSSGSRTVASPLLLDGKIIVKTPNLYEVVVNPYSKTKAVRTNGSRLLALDAETGKQLWEAKPLPIYGWDWTAGTPCPVTLANGSEMMKVLVDSGGAVVRLDDGKVLVQQVGADSTDASIHPFGDMVIFPRPHLVGVRLIMIDRDHVGFQRTWSHQMGSHGIGYQGCLVSADGLLYHETGFGHFYRRWPAETESGPGESRICCIVKDARDGAEVAELDMHRKGGNYWGNAVATRDYVYMVGGDHIFRPGPSAPASITVLTRGRQPMVVVRNAIDRTYGGPAPDGERMYLRGYRGVWCIGYTGEEGRRYEALAMAEAVLDEIHADAPAAAPAPIAIPAAAAQPSVKIATSRLEHNRSPHSWLIAGPFPAGKSAEALAAIGGPAARLRPGMPVAIGDDKSAVAPMANAMLKRPGVVPWKYDPANFTLLDSQRRIVAFGLVTAGKARTVSYLYTELVCDRARAMRLENKTPGVRIWLSGREVRDGDRVQFAAGLCPMLMEVRADAADAEGPYLAPLFWNSDNPKAELAAWRDLATRGRGILENVVKLAPDSPEAKRAKAVLAALGQ